MPPKKRGGRSIGSVKAKLVSRVRKNQNTKPNSLPILSFDVLTENGLGTNSTTTRKVTTTANNEMQIKLSNEVIEPDITKGMLLTEHEPKNMRITRNNYLKLQPKKESISEDEIKTDAVLNVQPVTVMSLQENKDAPMTRKRKLVKNNSPESEDSSTTTKRRCKNKGGVNKNNITIRKQTKTNNRRKVIKNKKSSAFQQTVSDQPSPISPRKVMEVRNKESLNFEVTITGAPPPPEGPELSAPSPFASCAPSPPPSAPCAPSPPPSASCAPSPSAPCAPSPPPSAPCAPSPPPSAPCAPSPSPSPCPSWTRDISSSSAVTCFTVRTDDIVCIDNKLPLLRLTDVVRAPRPAPAPAPDRARSASRSSSSSTSCSSASSDTRPGYSNTGSHADLPGDDDDDDRALEKLSTEFKKKDVEMIELISCENRNDSPALRNLRKRVCKALTEESEVIAHCNALKKLLIRNYEELFSDIEPCENREVVRPQDEHFIKPREVRKSNPCETAIKPGSKTICDERGRAPTPAPLPACPNPGDERGNDDDDALSLFAESITGLDSSRRHDSLPQDNSLPGDSGEYIPRPKNGNKKSETVTYRPSLIGERNEDGPRDQKVKIVCEKQNADSTSMYRENRNFYDNTSDIGVDNESLWPWPGSPRAAAAPPAPLTPPMPPAPDSPPAPDTPPASDTPPAPAVKPGPEGAGRPVFIANIYPVPTKIKSFVFMGVCFYNLASKCKRERCQFLHADLPASTLSARLRRLDGDALFVHEYMTMRSWAALRRRYGLAFVLEGVRRGLARVLLEMAIDFARCSAPNHPEDKALTVKVLEAIMLYLNTIDVREYGEFLEFPATDGRLLCDIFMETLASTQNFSRFKSIFVNLTEFMDRIPRPFEFEVASALLERVCILPHETRTAAAMLVVLRRTSPRVLHNAMFGLFQRRLAADERLARDFEALKRSAELQAAAEPWPSGGFSPDTTDCASAAPANAIDSHLVESFRKLGSSG
ncbi:uncharacterized protein LOC106713039, partial [Papilio machaon]|uniref:uncharacterized protein LOC106713039 n=1 Tax=Papilio machaon TaxID=76193 RepID=UPI001E6630C6